MTHFHCLHGAWHGAWVWNEFGRRMREQGHTVSAPDLPGLGSLAAEINPDIGLAEHIEAARPPERSVLLAHSYAGVLARGISDSDRGLISHIILIEALWPDHGESALQQLAETAQAGMQARIENEGKGWMIPAPDATQFDINDAELEQVVNSRLTPHPAKTFTDPIILTNATTGASKTTDANECEPTGTYLISNDRAVQPYTETAKRLGNRGWHIVESSGGHALMQTRPELIVNLSLELAHQENNLCDVN